MTSRRPLVIDAGRIAEAANGDPLLITGQPLSVLSPGGMLALGGFVGTLPESLTFAGRDVANTFSQLQTVSRADTSTSAITSIDSSLTPNPSADITASTIDVGIRSTLQTSASNAALLSGLTLRALSFIVAHRGSGAINGLLGAQGEVRVSGAGNATTGTGFQALLSYPDSTVAGNFTNARGVFADFQFGSHAGTVAITTAEGFRTGLTSLKAGGTITSLYGLHVVRPIASGTLTNTRGIYIENQTSSGGTHTNTPHGIYQEGSGDLNYFAGKVGLNKATSIGAQLHIVAGSSATIGQIIQGAASHSVNLLEIQSSSAAVLACITALGGAVFNEQGNDADVRIEGDTDADLFFVDASTDRVGIGTNAPNNKLDVAGTVQMNGLRIDVTPTAETPTMTHTFTVSLNGTNYKIPVVAA